MTPGFLCLTVSTGLAVRDTCDAIYIDTLRYLSIHPNWVIIDGDCALRHGVMINEIVLTWLVI